jgi:sporulation protein YlmC with PRC-barrel domain
MKTSELFGKEVLDANAYRIGKVSDIDFDPLSGVVNHLIVKAGFTKKYVVTLANIDKIGDRVILRIKAEDLK